MWNRMELIALISAHLRGFQTKAIEHGTETKCFETFKILKQGL